MGLLGWCVWFLGIHRVPPRHSDTNADLSMSGLIIPPSSHVGENLQNFAARPRPRNDPRGLPPPQTLRQSPRERRGVPAVRFEPGSDGEHHGSPNALVVEDGSKRRRRGAKKEGRKRCNEQRGARNRENSLQQSRELIAQSSALVPQRQERASDGSAADEEEESSEDNLPKRSRCLVLLVVHCVFFFLLFRPSFSFGSILDIQGIGRAMVSSVRSWHKSDGWHTASLSG